MPLPPPYLFPCTSDRAASRVAVVGDVASAITELAVHGQWDHQAAWEVATTVDRCLAEHPRGLILDLYRLDDPAAASVSAWLNVRRRCARLDPPTHLAICLRPQTPLTRRLHAVGAHWRLPMVITVAEAHAALTDRMPAADQLSVRLSARPEAVALATDLAASACHAWQLPDLQRRARLVMGELVTNAVDHAGTELRVTVSRRSRRLLHLAVRDRDPRPPHLPDPPTPDTPEPDPRRGLWTVQAHATAWGAVPTRNGKIVWATLLSRTSHRQ